MAVFIGRKLDLQKIQPEVPPDVFLLDEVFRARYHVVQVVCGELPTPEVEFEVADHYGRPAFENHDTVLLFLSRAQAGWYHEKYQYFDVYETADGGWASCGDPFRFDHPMHRGSIRAQPITFKHEVSFPVAGLTEEEIRERHSAEYFERQGDRVVCRRGARVPELFAVKRDGVLKARGLFR